MHIPLGDLSDAEISVDDVDRQEQGLRQELEVIVDVDQPVDQLRPDGLLDLLLSAHVSGVGVPLTLVAQHVLVDVRAKL